MLLFDSRQLRVDDGIDQTRGAVTLPFVVNLHLIQIERVETDFDVFAGELRRRFKEPVMK